MRRRTPEQVAADVGVRIRELRRAAHLTQELFAERLEMTRQYLQRVEAGQINMSVAALVRFAHALGVEPAALLEPPTDRTKPRRGRPAGSTSTKRAKAPKAARSITASRGK